jgi:hypothetical protein
MRHLVLVNAHANDTKYNQIPSEVSQPSDLNVWEHLGTSGEYSDTTQRTGFY